MAHPHASHRQHHVEHRRVGHITKGYASGGSVHGDAAEDKALIKKTVKRSALKVAGDKPKHRADRPHRAKGGRTNRKGGKTVVNVIAGGGHPGMAAPAMAAPPMAPPSAPPPAMPPRPPMMPPPGAGAMPPGMPPRKAGGRAYARGGAVKDGPAYKEGLRDGTQIQHTDGKGDQAGLHRGKPITYKTGGKVEAPKGVSSPPLPGGSGGGEARLAKEKRAAKEYARA